MLTFVSLFAWLLAVLAALGLGIRMGKDDQTESEKRVSAISFLTFAAFAILLHITMGIY